MKYGLIKILSLSVCSGFLMSATNCAKPSTETRELKKNVRVMSMSASTFLDNSGFSFSETAQSQLSGVLFEQNHFFERNVYPQLTSGAQDQKYYQVSKASAEQINKWFPTAKTQEIALSQDSACLITRPQHFIAGKINALEAWGGGALQFGFNQTVVKLPVSVDFKLDKMRMDLSFHAFDPWTQQNVASVNSEAFKTDYKIGVGIDVGYFHIGPEFYRTTGMAETTLKGLRKGLSDLATKLFATAGQDWSTRIMYSRDNYVLILGGQELGLKNGDQFKVFNQVHNWNGEPCGDSSILNGSTIVSDTQDPWIVEIEDAGTLMAKARVLNPKENVSINTGALVKLHQFVKEPDTAAKK